jgi:hypothetical protein
MSIYVVSLLTLLDLQFSAFRNQLKQQHFSEILEHEFDSNLFLSGQEYLP